MAHPGVSAHVLCVCFSTILLTKIEITVCHNSKHCTKCLTKQSSISKVWIFFMRWRRLNLTNCGSIWEISTATDDLLNIQVSMSTPLLITIGCMLARIQERQVVVDTKIHLIEFMEVITATVYHLSGFMCTSCYIMLIRTPNWNIHISQRMIQYQLSYVADVFVDYVQSFIKFMSLVMVDELIRYCPFSMTLNSHGAIREMNDIVSVAAICAATDDFPFRSYPTCSCLASPCAGPVGCISYNMYNCCSNCWCTLGLSGKKEKKSTNPHMLGMCIFVRETFSETKFC